MKKTNERENIPALKKLSRAELLELLLEQSKEVERLSALLEDRAAEIENLKGQLKHRDVDADSVNALADAVARLNHVFDAAEAAAQQYMGMMGRRHG